MCSTNRICLNWRWQWTFLWMILAQASIAAAEDWPMFGRDRTRNSVSSEANPPQHWQVEVVDRSGKITQSSENIRWQAPLGSTTFGDPVVSGGLIWIGTNNNGIAQPDAPDASVLACFRESDGKLLYRYVSPRLPQGRVHDWPYSAMACSPLIEGERLWFTTNRAEVICFDIGPLLRDEGQPRELWKVDMMKEFGVKPCGSRMTLCHFCSIASHGDLIYVITGNGVGDDRLKVSAPDAPSLICFHKDTGKVAWTDNSPGANILSGQWSSPLVIEVGGQAQVVVPQGDGWIRSFEPATGKLLWKFDMNRKTAHWALGGSGSRNDILATPVFYGGRIYVASGQEPEHGDGDGRLVCIDPTRTGDISSELAVDADGQPLPVHRLQAVDPKQGQRAIANPNSGLVWECVNQDSNGDGKIDFEEGFYRTCGSVSIKDDLLVVSNFNGLIHCLDAKTGKVHWRFDALASIYGAPLIVGDKVYIADEDGDVAILGLSADPSRALRNLADGPAPLAEVNVDDTVYCSPIFANGTLYVASRDTLYAIRADGRKQTGYWPQWRGPQRDNVSPEWGLLQQWPEGGPPLTWRTDGIGQGIASVALAKGSIYTLGSAGEHEHVVALDEATGQLRWKAPIGPAINDAPLMRWLSQRTPTVDADRIYASTAEGNLICLQTADGKELWRKNYPADFGSVRPTWGFVDHPLVDGDQLICKPGGKEATIVALDKRTGEVIWKCLLDPAEGASYPATIKAGVGYVAILQNCVVGISTDGKLLWRHDNPRLGWVNAVSPLAAGNSIILPGGHLRSEMIVLKITRQRMEVEMTEISRSRQNLEYFQDSTVRLGEYLFTAGRGSLPLCLRWRTGETLWGPIRPEAKGKVAITYADHRLYLLFADGTCILAEASPKEFRPTGKFVLPDHEPAIGATFPVITGGRLYIRDNDRLFAYDVRAGDNGRAGAPQLNRLDLAYSKDSPRAERARGINKQPDAIFVPTPHDVVAKMLEVASVEKSSVVYDLGSGDGRIVIAAAQTYGSKAVGIELDRALAAESLDRVQKAALGELVEIRHADIFEQDLSQANVVALYLPPKLMDRLLPQLEKLEPGSRIVSHFFKFTDIPPDKSLKFDSQDDGDSHEIYMWTTPLRKPAR